MKDTLCTTPVLAYPNFKLPFILSTDASRFALGAILSQIQDGLERPICYVNRQRNKAEQAYTTSELEMLLWFGRPNTFVAISMVENS